MYEGIVVDYGHGIDTPGKYYKFTDHQGFECREWITNRMTAARFIKFCVLDNRAHYDCVADKVWTRTEVLASDWSWKKLYQKDVPLATRAARANTRSRWPLLSFHSNAIGYANEGPSLNARGGCMYTSPGQTAADKIAESIYSAFVKSFKSEPVFMQRGDLSDGDHDREARFSMLTKTIAPAILGEMLFFVNINDARYLMSARGQDVIAYAYYTGIAPYIRIR